MAEEDPKNTAPRVKELGNLTLSLKSDKSATIIIAAEASPISDHKTSIAIQEATMTSSPKKTGLYDPFRGQVGPMLFASSVVDKNFGKKFRDGTIVIVYDGAGLILCRSQGNRPNVGVSMRQDLTAQH